MYDKNNIFAKILRQEIKAEIIYEDDKLIAIKDIFPKAKIHVLVIPKGEYIDIDDFATKSNAEDLKYFFTTTNQIAKKLGVFESGYRIISNKGTDATQTVKHFHMHILGGEPLSGM